jgi:hypothetical protein
MAQCEVCGTEVVQGRGRARRTCSAACRQKAHRQRQAQQVAQLRAAAAARPVLALVPPAPAAAEASTPDAGPAGRIRATGAALAASIERAAQRAADGWTPQPEASAAETWAAAVRAEAEEVVAAILASNVHGPSRDEPAVPAPEPAGPEVPAAEPEPSRNEPAVRRPARRKRLTRKAAHAIADRSHLVRDERHEGWLLRDDETGTVLGHVEPSYGGTSVSGRNGWTYRVDGSFARTGPYKTRDKAAVPCALAWIRLVTAPVRDTLTGS